MCQGGGLNALVDSICFGFKLILLEQRSGGPVWQGGESNYGVSSCDKARLGKINRQNVLKMCRSTTLLYLSSRVRDTVSERHTLRMASYSISFTQGQGDVGGSSDHGAN